MTVKTLGILGGGQLGRMSALAAARLGISCIIYTPEDNSPAAQVAYKTILGDYLDKAKLKDFAALVDVISYEFENIPVETVQYLKTLKPVLPNDNLLDVAQDRIKEKSFLNSIGIPTARWAAVDSSADILKSFEKWESTHTILKTARFGYDGKGQARIHKDSDINATLQKFTGKKLILEDLVDFDCEISVIVARDKSGNIESYGPMRNEHANHILSKTTIPAGIPDILAAEAVTLTKKLAESLNLIGVLALEMFVTKDGRILANEIAPRTHNSGHWTIDACAVSQFENHVRAVCGLPLGKPARHSDAEMLNLIGDDINKVPNYLKQENACVHLYGKHDSRAGRKMGHVTLLKEKA